ncbi:eukaryotic translation initiation factor 2-alpha kinase 1-like isoform X2 [Oratosquilla oratoria]|uniref:eukaryotic translation initiation factor 2-alpha kinase 1-like isoform X2 n=1 Tax=Oratosquilla oratoria TaxID=337810 RepID=UPI003F76C7E4
MTSSVITVNEQVGGAPASQVSKKKIPKEGRMSDQSALSSSKSSSEERGTHGHRRELRVVSPNIIIEIMIHLLCNAIEENPVKRRILFQAICQNIKKIHPKFMCLISDPIRPYESHPNFLQMFKNIIDLTQNQICVGDLPATYPSLNFDLVRAHQRIHIPGVDDRFSKEFKIHSILGKGGFGVVLKAEHIIDTSSYAVKIITLRSHKETDFSRVIREVQTLSKLQHEGIVKYNTTWIQSYSFHDLPNWTSSDGTDEESDDTSSSLASSLGSLAAPPSRNHSSLPSSIFPVITEIKGENNMSSEDIVFEDSNPSCEVRRQMKPIELKDSDKESLNPKHGQRSVRQNCMEVVQKSHNTVTNRIITTNMCLFIQMELCGDSLDKWIRNRIETHDNEIFFSGIDLEKNKTILLELFEAIRYMHSKNVIHRDLKPANIMFDTENKHIKLGDFGLSRHLIEPAQNMNCMTPLTECRPHTTGVGTKVYIAPEQLSGTNYDAKSDIYSLGIIILELYQLFNTESEKYEYIFALRNREPLKNMKPHFIHPYLKTNLPQVVSLITQLTEPLPQNRPSAEDALCLLKELPSSIEADTDCTQNYDCSPGSKLEDGSGRVFNGQGANSIKNAEFAQGANSIKESKFAQGANSIKESKFAQDGNGTQKLQLTNNENIGEQYSLRYNDELHYSNLEKIKDLQNENTILKEEKISLVEENSRLLKEIEILKSECLHTCYHKES